jgi:hypothetical protein
LWWDAAREGLEWKAVLECVTDQAEVMAFTPDLSPLELRRLVRLSSRTLLRGIHGVRAAREEVGLVEGERDRADLYYSKLIDELKSRIETAALCNQ